MTKDATKAIKRMADLLSQENAALKTLDFPAAVALVRDKEAALQDLALPAPSRDHAPSLLQLGRLAAENKALLARAIVVQTRVIRLLVQAASAKRLEQRYTANGAAFQPRQGRAMTLSARV